MSRRGARMELDDVTRGELGELMHQYTALAPFYRSPKPELFVYREVERPTTGPAIEKLCPVQISHAFQRLSTPVETFGVKDVGDRSIEVWWACDLGGTKDLLRGKFHTVWDVLKRGGEMLANLQPDLRPGGLTIERSDDRWIMFVFELAWRRIPRSTLRSIDRAVRTDGPAQEIKNRAGSLTLGLLSQLEIDLFTGSALAVNWLIQQSESCSTAVRRRGRRPEYDKEEDKRLCESWARARAAGVKKARFCADGGTSVEELDRALARERRRGRR
jgi:hypothetical protein